MGRWRARAGLVALFAVALFLEVAKRRMVGGTGDPVRAVAATPSLTGSIAQGSATAGVESRAATAPPPPGSPAAPPPGSPPSPVASSSSSSTDGGASAPRECGAVARLELGGEVVDNGWGSLPSNLARTPAECCAKCRAHPECNAWVHCGEEDACDGKRRQCWLKRQDGGGTSVMASGEDVPWTSGLFSDRKRMQRERRGDAAHQAAPNAQTTNARANARSPPLGSSATPDDSSFRALDVLAGDSTPPARTRECGDPAIDGYAHVVPECFDASATNREFDRSAAARERNVAWFEPHASYDGLAVAWGIGNVKQTARECAEACRAHVPPGKARGGPFGDLPCNAWVWCPIELERCFEPDAHTHRGGDCWLKFTETPEAPQLNQRGRNDDRRMAKDGVSYRKRHGDAPEEAHWWSGVMLPPGWTPSNGTYGPRATW